MHHARPFFSYIVSLLDDGHGTHGLTASTTFWLLSCKRASDHTLTKRSFFLCFSWDTVVLILFSALGEGWHSDGAWALSGLDGTVVRGRRVCFWNGVIYTYLLICSQSTFLLFLTALLYDALVAEWSAVQDDGCGVERGHCPRNPVAR